MKKLIVKKCPFILVFIAILYLILPVTAMGYEADDVICNVDSLINGNASQGSVLKETALGDIASDALLDASGADIAIVNGGDLRSNLLAGPCKWSDVRSVFRENKTIAVTQISASQLWNLLEYGTGFTVIGQDEKTDWQASEFDGFPQVAGVEFEYDTTAPAGSRIRYIMVGDTPVQKYDDQTMFTLCATDFMLSGGYGYESFESESLEIGLADALAGYLKQGTFQATTLDDGRIKMLGTKDEPLIARSTVFVVGLIVCFGCYLYNKVKNKVAPDRTLNSHIDPNR